jgi:hypothetical protein
MTTTREREIWEDLWPDTEGAPTAQDALAVCRYAVYGRYFKIDTAAENSRSTERDAYGNPKAAKGVRDPQRVGFYQEEARLIKANPKRSITVALEIMKEAYEGQHERIEGDRFRWTQITRRIQLLIRLDTKSTNRF